MWSENTLPNQFTIVSHTKGSGHEFTNIKNKRDVCTVVWYTHWSVLCCRYPSIPLDWFVILTRTFSFDCCNVYDRECQPLEWYHQDIITGQKARGCRWVTSGLYSRMSLYNLLKYLRAVVSNDRRVRGKILCNDSVRYNILHNSII